MIQPHFIKFLAKFTELSGTYERDLYPAPFFPGRHQLLRHPVSPELSVCSGPHRAKALTQKRNRHRHWLNWLWFVDEAFQGVIISYPISTS